MMESRGRGRTFSFYQLHVKSVRFQLENKALRLGYSACLRLAFRTSSGVERLTHNLLGYSLCISIQYKAMAISEII